MNIKELIAKFQKEGYAALTSEEKDLLTQKASLMTKALQAKFNEGVDEENAEEGDKEEEKKDDAEETNVDEKALSALIQKHVAAKVDEMSTKMAEKFMEGAKAQRAKILSGEAKPANDQSETRMWVKALLTGDHTKAAQFNEDADNARGGYLVPPQLMAEVLRIIPTGYGVARSDMTYLPFSGPGNERKIPTLASGITATWTGEGVAKTGTNPTFGLVTQTLKKLACIIPFTEEILEDSAINLTQLVATLFAEAVAKEEDIQFFMGTGSPWTGILMNGDVNSVPFSGSFETTALSDALLDMQYATPSGALAGAKYYMHRQFLGMVRKLKSTVTGAYIFQDAVGNAPASLLGYPVQLCEAFPTTTDYDNGYSGGAIGFGNLKVAAYLGDKQQIRAKLLDQATITDGDGTTVINLAEQDMLALRLEERVGYVVAVPKAFTILTPVRGS